MNVKWWVATAATTSNGYYYAYCPAYVPSGSRYRIIVISYNDATIADTSAYFSIQTVPADAYEPDGSAASSVSITTDGVQQSHTLTGGDYDWMSFFASSGTSYTMETFGTAADTYMYLYSTDGTTVLASDDDGGTGINSAITWTCAMSGTYYLVISGYGGATGPYSVSVTSH
jgi:hypothetical protein